jgi:hypothetical protein
MYFTVLKLNDLDRIIHHLLAMESHWMYRGHSCATWELESTLERALKPLSWPPELAEKWEEASMYRFKSRAHHYIGADAVPKSKLGWLSLMQHHGVPTRLLDFTTSPFMAFFFAFDGVDPDQKEDCAIWALDFRALKKAAWAVVGAHDRSSAAAHSYNSIQIPQDSVFKKYVDTERYDILWATEPGVFNLRLERQQGTFLLSGNVKRRIGDLLPGFLSPTEITRIDIPASLSIQVYRAMSKMGITSARLFSSIDGLGKDIARELAQEVTYKGRGLK